MNWKLLENSFENIRRDKISTQYSPRVVTDGLQLYYDVNNIKSYPGEPTENLVANATEPEGNWGSRSGATFIENNNLPGNHSEVPTNCIGYKMDINSSASTWSGNSYSYSNVGSETVSLAESMTFSCWCYVSEDFNANWARCSSEGSGTGTTYYNLSLKGTWQRLTHEYSATSAGSADHFLYWSKEGGTTFALAGLTGYIIYCAPQVERKSHATQFVNGTRSSTDGLKDLSGQGNHAELANATYDSNALIDYDGVSGYSTISDSSTLDIQGAMSIGAWIKLDTLTTTPSDPAIYARYDGTTAGTRQFWFSYRNAGSDKGIALYVVDSSNVLRGAYRTDWSPSIDTWYYIMGVFSPSNYMRIYINSVLDYEITTSIPADVHSTSIDSYIGAAPNYSTGYHFDGKIDLVQQYNQALTSQEILNNYNAQKSRFGH